MPRTLLITILALVLSGLPAYAEEAEVRVEIEEEVTVVDRVVANPRVRSGAALIAMGLVTVIPGLVLPALGFVAGLATSSRHGIDGPLGRVAFGDEDAASGWGTTFLGMQLEGAFALASLTSIPAAVLLVAGPLMGLGGIALLGSGIPAALASDDEEDEPDAPSRTESRAVGAFTRVRVEGGLELEVRQADTTAVEVTAPADRIAGVETRVEGDTLVISSPIRRLRSRHARVVLTTPRLDEVDLSGAGAVEITGVRGDALRVHVGGAGALEVEAQVRLIDVELDGAGAVELRGTAEELRAVVAGTGAVDAAAMPVQRAVVEIRGAGSATVAPSELLDATIAGMGSVEYVGEPREVRRNVSGLGRVQPR